MSKVDDGGSAFPHTLSAREIDYRPGLTKREYFAAAALAASEVQQWTDPAAGANWMFEIADAMIAASKSGGSDE